MQKTRTYQYMVHVNCFTYNHAEYIEDALNGFCMQETTFPFICTIVDDASTDKEPEVLIKYLEDHFDLKDKTTVLNAETDDYCLTFAKHKTNRNCFFAVYFLKYNHYKKKIKSTYLKEWKSISKYYAPCEGDDYWINPNKLQKQVDFLENNPSYSMVYTHYKENVNGVLKKGRWNLLDGDCLKPYLLRQGFIPTASVLYRSSFNFSYDYLHYKFPLGDAPKWIQLMHSAPIKLLPDITTVYRILDGSASHPQDFLNRYLFDLGARECRKFFSDKYGYKDISSILEKEIIERKLYIELYKGNILSFFRSKPWQYGINMRTILGILKLRILNH